MKKRKIKLFASIASLALVVAVMGVGVWAATSASVTMTGKAQFTATKNVEAYISASSKTLTAAANTLSSETAADKQYAFITATNSKAATSKSDLTKSGAALNGYTEVTDNTGYSFTFTTAAISLEISDSTDIFMYTFTIVNNANSAVTNDTLVINFSALPATPGTGSPNYSITTTGTSDSMLKEKSGSTGGEAWGTTLATETNYYLPEGKSLTVTVTFQVSNAGVDIGETTLTTTFALSMVSEVPAATGGQT